MDEAAKAFEKPVLKPEKPNAQAIAAAAVPERSPQPGTEAANTPENTAVSLLQKAAESGIKRSEGTPAPNLPKVIRQRQNEVLPTTVEVDLPMVSGVVPSGAEIENVTIIGGAGTSMPIRDIARLVAIYTAIGNPSGWQKKAGIVKGAKYNYELHWYENSSIMPEAEIKLKGVKANERT